MPSLCITAYSEGFVAQHQHGNGYLKSYELTFVLHSSVAKSKRKIWVLVYSILWKWPPSLSPEMGFFSCSLCLSCFTRVFQPETFVECSMTNVLGKKKNWREMKFPSGWKLRKGCNGLPSKSHKLCSRYKRQHVPKSVLDICCWSFPYTFYSQSY